MTILIKNIGELATPVGAGKQSGAMQNDCVKRMKNAYILIDGSKIIEVGEGESPSADEVIDVKGALVTPGLVDPHTHLVFGGYREKELAMKLKGMDYLAIHNAGGGINSTVKATREASADELYAKASEHLDFMLANGVTSVEIKTGYGLDTENEVKMLQVIKKLKANHKVDIAITFMPLHSLPDDFEGSTSDYVKYAIDEMLPAVIDEGGAEFIDVFCEKDIFTAEECKQVLEAGKAAGLIPKCHTNEIERIGGVEMATSIGSISMEHLIVANSEDIAVMKNFDTIACLLPATSFYLGSTYALAREMIDNNVAVAFGSDFNPGSCPNNNFVLAMNIGCLKYKMTPEESLCAATLNAAAAINRAKDFGSIEVGKQADILIWDANNLDYIFYRFGQNLVSRVIKSGEKI